MGENSNDKLGLSSVGEQVGFLEAIQHESKTLEEFCSDPVDKFVGSYSDIACIGCDLVS